MEDKINRLWKFISYLIGQEMISPKVIQKDIAEKMNANYTNVNYALNGKDKYLTDSFIGRFNATYGNLLNIDWLNTGKGHMLGNDNSPAITNIPTTDQDIKILDIRVCAGHGIGFEGKENKVVGYVNIPDFTGCYGITVYGDSMHDKYASGDTIFVREIKDKSLIDNGQPYVVITDEDRLLKMVYIEQDELKLVSYNTICNPDGRRKYPDMEIKGSQILHLYKVVGKLARTQM